MLLLRAKMTLIEGVNCGFVSVAPTEDPDGGTSTDIDWVSRAMKAETSTDQILIEIGWYCVNASEESDFDIAIYEHDAEDNEPGDSVLMIRDNAKGTTLGWKRITGLNIELSANTTYWLAVQLDNTATRTDIDLEIDESEELHRQSWQTELPDPWGDTENLGESTHLMAIYAVCGTPVIEEKRGIILRQQGGAMFR